MNRNNDEDDQENYQEKVEAVTRLYRRRPHNMIEEVEKLGFEYCVDDGDDVDEIAEEKAAWPANENEKQLVAFLESRAEPDKDIAALWRLETHRDDTSVALWRRYFRSGSAQLKKLILFELDTHSCDQILLMQLAFLHEFIPMHRELLARYVRACDEETGLKKFAVLVQDFDEASDSFGYDALQALSDRYMENSVKKQVIEDLLAERKTHENEIVTF